MSLSDDLRQAADLIDAHPEKSFTMAGGITLYVGRHSGSFTDTVRWLTQFGTVKKERPGQSFLATVVVGKIELAAIDYDDEVACELVQTGEREVTRDIVKVVGTETVTEPIMEWKCPPSILAGAS